MSEAIIWILDAPGQTFGQHIIDFGGVLGGLGGRSGEDLESEVDVNKEIADFMKSMLSPTWEHGFLMVWGWICDDF